MNISPVNYQMNMVQNNSLNFKSKGSVAETFENSLVRSKRTYYPKGQQPLWKDLLEKFTRGFARKEESHYPNVNELVRRFKPSKIEKLLGISFEKRGSNVKTVYYDAQGNEMATVYDIPKGMDRHLTLHTQDKDFRDFGKTGVVDCYDEDQLVEVPKIMRNELYPKKWTIKI